MNKNLGAFENYIESLHHKFNVFGFTDTWLKDSDCGLFSIPGYDMTKKHRSDRPGGVVAVFVNDDLKYSVRDDIDIFNSCMESLFIEVNKEER